jgi:hypothetical protein
MVKSIRGAIPCLLIIAALLATLTGLLATLSASAATSTSADSQGEQGQAYLFEDAVHGTQLYVNTGSEVYRFGASDGYDTGTVAAKHMFVKPNISIMICDSDEGFIFGCIINFKANRCLGYLWDEHGTQPYQIRTRTAGAEVVENAVVPATTVVLGETTLDCLSWASEDFSTLTFENVTRQLGSLSVGDVIASGVSEATPYGLLREVVNVFSDGNQMTVETVAATLEDAIEECDVDGMWSLLPDGSAVPLGMVASESCQNCTLPSDTNIRLDSVDGTTSTASTGSCTGWYIDIDDVVLFDADGDLGTKDDQIVASGSLCADIYLDFGLTIEDWAVEEAHFSVTTTETTQLEIALKVTIAEFHGKIELYRQYLNPIVFWVGFVPVVITPVLTFNVGVDAEALAGVATSITQTANLTVGVSYDDGIWSPVTDFSTSFGWEPPTLTAGCEVKGYVGPQLSLLLYGLVGPYGEITGYLELDADLFKTPWWELYGGLEADVGFRIEVLGYDIVDYEVPNAIGYRVLLAQAESPPPDPIVTFPDPNLEAAIREAIGKPSGPIYASDLVGLTSLQARERNIADLTGLEHCTSLIWLFLGENQISDLSQLSGLTSLYCLALDANQISDLSPLSGLTSLMALYLQVNQISDLSPLSGLTSLTEVRLGWNQISDLSPLSGLTSLVALTLDWNQISDLSPLSGLTSLQFLVLWHNQISDIKALVDNPGLASEDIVDLKDNPLSSTSIDIYIPQLEARGVWVSY